MGTKLIIGKEKYDLPRGSVIPTIGDSFRITLRGETNERLYSVHLIEHIHNFNGAQIGNTEIILKEIKGDK